MSEPATGKMTFQFGEATKHLKGSLLSVRLDSKHTAWAQDTSAGVWWLLRRSGSVS